MHIKNISIFCGAHEGANPNYKKAAIEVANIISSKKIGIVFGGGDVGLMKVVSDVGIDYKVLDNYGLTQMIDWKVVNQNVKAFDDALYRAFKIQNKDKIFFKKNGTMLKKLGRINNFLLKDKKSPSATIIIKGDLLYIAYYHDGLRVFDISNPSNPIQVNSYDTYLPNNHISYRGAWGVYPYLNSGNTVSYTHLTLPTILLV